MKLPAILMLLASFLFLGCAGSSSHLLGSARPPINPADVQIYRTPPAHYERIATLDASSSARFFHGSQSTDADAIRRLQEAAAKLGANGVLLTLVGDEPSGSFGLGFGGGGYSRNTAVNGEASGAAPLVRTGAHGLAIYVPGRR